MDLNTFYLKVLPLIILVLIFLLRHEIYLFFAYIRMNYLYKKYHQSFTENLLEAQTTKKLPESTLIYKAKYNALRVKILEIEPDTVWKELR